MRPLLAACSIALAAALGVAGCASSPETKRKAKERFGYLLRNEPHPSDGKLS